MNPTTEHIIKVNMERGYKLHSFSSHATIEDGVLNETIIAVFEKVPA